MDRYAGMLERVDGDTLDAVGAACVGGGSLIYGGVLLQPRRDIFEELFPSISYDEMDRVFYPRVLEKIGASGIPDDVLASDPYLAHRVFLEGNACLPCVCRRATPHGVAAGRPCGPQPPLFPVLFTDH